MPSGNFAIGSSGRQGRSLGPDAIFDCQVKRIHEYKRQLLNALRIVVLYNRLRENPELDMQPRTFFFAGKAAPAYRLADWHRSWFGVAGGGPLIPKDILGGKTYIFANYQGTRFPLVGAI